MSADNGAFTNPPPGPSQPPHQPHQPRWAWWVVGILIPLLGILVTVLVSRPGSSDGKNDGNSGAPASTRSSAPAGSGATPDQSADQPAEEPSKSAPAAKPAFGPKVIEVDTTDSGSSYMEFDTSEPLVVADSTKGADLIINATTGSAPDLFVPDSHMTLAPLAGSGAAPTADECAASVQRNGTYTLQATRGGGFCLTTTEGRTVYLKVITAPPAGLVKLEVTVWA